MEGLSINYIDSTNEDVVVGTEEFVGYESAIKDISDGLFYIAENDEKAVGCFGLKKFENNPFNNDSTGLYFYHFNYETPFGTNHIYLHSSGM